VRWGLLPLLLLAAEPEAVALAAPADARIDTARSLATFSVRAVWIKRIEGRFAHIEGSIRPELAPDRYALRVRVASGSVLMAREGYEEWARSPDFFDTAQHPWIEFEARDLPGELLRAGGEIEGLLTLRGEQRPVRFELLPSDCAQAGFECPVQARGEVERSDFGMDARRLFVGDKVRLNFDIRLREASAEDAG
jgi:polyisoprenoid-binding protein YceI